MRKVDFFLIMMNDRATIVRADGGSASTGVVAAKMTDPATSRHDKLNKR
jgi:hypothetical protein